MRVARYSLPLTRLIHENLSIMMTFAYSRKPLEAMVTTSFAGQWKYLNKALFEIPAERAEKACLELALFLRMLDDEEKLIQASSANPYSVMNGCGTLFKTDSTQIALNAREAANKVIHAAQMEWVFDPRPRLVCHGRPSDAEKWGWTRAEIDVVALAAVCGMLMS